MAGRFESFAMSSEPTSLPPPVPVSRSILVTLAGILVIVIGAIGSPISLFAIASIIVGGYGSKTFELSGFIIVVLGPFIMIATGIGLLKRWRWALYVLNALLVWMVVGNVWNIVRGPLPERKYVSSGGVPTTVLATPVDPYSMPLAVIGGVFLIIFLTRRIRSEFR